MSPGEYTAGFIKSSTGIGYTIGTDPSALGGTGGVGTQGIPIEIATTPANQTMASVCSGLHDGGFISTTGFAYMYGQANNCQLGNGLTTGPSTTYEILTDVNGESFGNLSQMTAGWCITAAAPFYGAIKSTGGDTVWLWGNGATVGLSSCIKPTPTIVSVGRTVASISAQNSSIHAICTDGTLWVLGGTDDYPANTGTNSTPTTWTQVTLPGGQLAASIAKGNSFVFVISTTGHLNFFGEYGWIGENKSTNAYTPITTPTEVDSYFPSGIFPISQMVAIHVGYAILTTTNKLFTGGSSEVGNCGTGSTIYWPTYTGTNGLTPWDWDVTMGESVNQCTQIAKNANVTWSQLFGGPLYSFYFLAEDNNGNLYGAGRDKAGGIPDGEIPADTLNAGSPSIAADYNMSWNHLWFTSLPDPLSLTGSIVSSCPSCVTGYLTGTPCSYGTDAPSRPNTNLHANLVLTPFAGGFSWSSSTSTTDGSHKIMWSQSYITQNSGTSISLGVTGGESGSITGVPAGTYVINDTIVDNSWDTAFTTASVTVSTTLSTGSYFATAGTGTACTHSLPCPTSYIPTVTPLLLPGDSVYLNKGDAFPLDMLISVSGAAGNDIVITSYGSGPDPILGGMTTLSSPTNPSGNLWQWSWSGPTPRLLTINGTLVGKSGTASGYTTFIPASGSTTDLHFTSNPFSVGDSIIVKSSGYTLDFTVCTASTSTDATISPAVSYNNVGGNGAFKIGGTPTTQGAWNLPSAGTVQAYSVGSPSGYSVPNLGIPLTITGNYIKVTGIKIMGADTACIILSGSHDVIASDTLEYGVDGIQISSAVSDTVESCYIAHLGDNGVLKKNTSNYNNVYLSNTLFDIGMIPGMGTSGSTYQTYCGIVAGDSGSIVKYGMIDSIGYIGVANYGSGFVVDSLIIGNTTQVKVDGAAVYTWVASLPSYARERQIIGVVGYNGAPAAAFLGTSLNNSAGGSLIYLDNYANNTLVSGCSGYNFNGPAFFDHGPGNTFLNCSALASGYADFLGAEVGPVITGLTVKYCNFGSGTLSLPSVRLTTINNDLNTMGVIDSNAVAGVVGAMPFWTFSTGGGDPGTFRSLANWTAQTGYDSHSTAQTGQVTMVYNVTSSNVTANLPGHYRWGSQDFYGLSIVPIYQSQLFVLLTHGQPLRANNISSMQHP